MIELLLKLYGVDVILSFAWLAELLIKEKIRDIKGMPSAFNDLDDDYLKY